MSRNLRRGIQVDNLTFTIPRTAKKGICDKTIYSRVKNLTHERNY